MESAIESGSMDDGYKCMEYNCFCSTNASDFEKLQNLFAINGNFEGSNVVLNVAKSKRFTNDY